MNFSPYTMHPKVAIWAENPDGGNMQTVREIAQEYMARGCHVTLMSHDAGNSLASSFKDLRNSPYFTLKRLPSYQGHRDAGRQEGINNAIAKPRPDLLIINRAGEIEPLADEIESVIAGLNDKCYRPGAAKKKMVIIRIDDRAADKAAAPPKRNGHDMSFTCRDGAVIASQSTIPAASPKAVGNRCWEAFIEGLANKTNGGREEQTGREGAVSIVRDSLLALIDKRRQSEAHRAHR